MLSAVLGNHHTICTMSNWYRTIIIALMTINNDSFETIWWRQMFLMTLRNKALKHVLNASTEVNERPFTPVITVQPFLKSFNNVTKEAWSLSYQKWLLWTQAICINLVQWPIQGNTKYFSLRSSQKFVTKILLMMIMLKVYWLILELRVEVMNSYISLNTLTYISTWKTESFYI